LSPRAFFSWWGIFICSLAVGLYIGSTIYFSSRAIMRQLQFIPEKQDFAQEIDRCGFLPNSVMLRYSYAEDGVAKTIGNMVQIDPLMWHGLDDDRQAQKAIEVLNVHVVPVLSKEIQELYANIKKDLSFETQRFIFRHELGHVARNYSVKKILLMGLTGVSAAAIALVAAKLTIGFLGGLGAFIVGVIVGGCTDLCITNAGNYFFKQYEEVMADRFAIAYSSAQEIEAPADFFEQYDLLSKPFRKKNIGTESDFWYSVLFGYPSGSYRVGYLRLAAKEK